MKLPFFASGIVLVLVLTFIAGAFTGSAALLIPAFCAMPFSLIWLGYTIGTSGLRITISSESAQSRAPRRRGTFDG